MNVLKPFSELHAMGSYTIEFVNGVGKPNDRPADLIQAAPRDLALLRMVLA